jgi:hypothetical protein
MYRWTKPGLSYRVRSVGPFWATHEVEIEDLGERNKFYNHFWDRGKIAAAEKNFGTLTSAGFTLISGKVEIGLSDQDPHAVGPGSGWYRLMLIVDGLEKQPLVIVVLTIQT